MKAISIRQPWAHLILHAGKDVENRSWYCRYRGPLLLHAAKSCTPEEWEQCAYFCFDRGLPEPPPLRELLRGGIIGQVQMVDCVNRSKSPWFVGEYGFVFENPQPHPFLPLRGQLGLFDVLLDTEKQLEMF